MVNETCSVYSSTADLVRFRLSVRQTPRLIQAAYKFSHAYTDLTDLVTVVAAAQATPSGSGIEFIPSVNAPPPNSGTATGGWSYMYVTHSASESQLWPLFDWRHRAFVSKANGCARDAGPACFLCLLMQSTRTVVTDWYSAVGTAKRAACTTVDTAAVNVNPSCVSTTHHWSTTRQPREHRYSQQHTEFTSPRHHKSTERPCVSSPLGRHHDNSVSTDTANNTQSSPVDTGQLFHERHNRSTTLAASTRAQTDTPAANTAQHGARHTTEPNNTADNNTAAWSDWWCGWHSQWRRWRASGRGACCPPIIYSTEAGRELAYLDAAYLDAAVSSDDCTALLLFLRRRCSLVLMYTDADIPPTAERRCRPPLWR